MKLVDSPFSSGASRLWYRRRPRRLDLPDIGAEISERLCATGPGKNPGQVENFDTLKCKHVPPPMNSWANVARLPSKSGLDVDQAISASRLEYAVANGELPLA